MMRLDFNVIVVDDDWDDDENNTGIKSLIQQLSTKIISKGFIPKISGFPNTTEANKISSKRIDLYLSDNNLGDNPNNQTSNAKNGGIEYYLQLKQGYICDFVLYTRSMIDEIINKLAADLTEKQDPNLFSRFTFVTRSEGGTNWHKSILDLIDHILSRREELNNLRGLYAQCASKIDKDLREKYPITKKSNFEDVINNIPATNINTQNRELLHEIRGIRNGLLHNDEDLCTISDEYVVRFEFNKAPYEIYESRLQPYREKLDSALNITKAL